MVAKYCLDYVTKVVITEDLVNPLINMRCHRLLDEIENLGSYP